jgi:hypothetical protein
MCERFDEMLGSALTSVSSGMRRNLAENVDDEKVNTKNKKNKENTNFA